MRWLRRGAARRALLHHWAAISLGPLEDPDKWRLRTPTTVDPEVADGVSAAQLRSRIASLGLPPLLPREMHELGSSLAARAQRLLSRPGTFSVMQFNLLAEGLSSGPKAPTPYSPTPGYQSAYGGFTSVPQPEVVFDWGQRKLRLVEEVLRYMPDVLTVQECDHFDDLLLPALRKEGYDGFFGPKRHSPSVDHGFYSDGPAIFWRSAVFERLGAERGYFEEDGSAGCRPFLIGLLRHKERDTTLLVATTHLKAKMGQENEEGRATQIIQLLDMLEARAAAKADAVLLCGDLNTDPYDMGPVHARCVPAVLRHPLSLRSAYPLATSEESRWWTTWKKRGENEIKHSIDYIFHSAALRPLRVLAPPDEAELEEARLPGLRYPSDHLSVLAEFEIIS